jgi:hypothetical protein
MIKMKLVVCLLFAAHVLCAQETIPVSGGDASGSGGTFSYSVGQLFYSSNTGSNGVVTQGIQQSIELVTLSNLELTALTLEAVTYPNPTSDYIVLAVKDTNLIDLTYAIYSIQGRVVLQGKVNQEATKIGMQGLSIGTYILKVSQSTLELKTFKIIKN